MKNLHDLRVENNQLRNEIEKLTGELDLSYGLKPASNTPPMPSVKPAKAEAERAFVYHFYATNHKGKIIDGVITRTKLIELYDGYIKVKELIAADHFDDDPSNISITSLSLIS